MFVSLSCCSLDKFDDILVEVLKMSSNLLLGSDSVLQERSRTSGIDNAALLDLNEYSVLRGTTLPVYTVAAQRIDP